MLNSTEKSNTIFIWCLFFVTPALSLFVSLKNFRSRWSKNIIWAFTVFYGFTFTFSVDNRGSDINRYISWFYSMRNSGMTFSEMTSLFYTDEDYADILQPVLTYFVGQLTDNYAYLIAAFGLVYGYFFSRNMWYVIERLKNRLDTKVLFLLIVFSLVAPIWNLNGFRFWTATHVFLFGLLPLLHEKKKLYIIPILLSPFVHFSFVLPVLITIGYFFIGNRPAVYYYFFLASIFITEINIQALSSLINNYMPSIFSARTAAYINEDTVEKIANSGPDTRNLYAVFYLKFLTWSVMAYVIYMYINRKVIENRPELKRMLAFTLFFFGVANIFSMVPSGSRFVIVADLMALALITQYADIAPKVRQLNLLFKATLPLLLLYIVVTIRNGFASIGVVTLAGNPVLALFVDSEVALIDLFK